MDESEFEIEEFWSNRIGINAGSYNSEVCRDLYKVAKCVCEGMFFDDISEVLGMSETHVELIQYILAGVNYPADDENQTWHQRDAFQYCTSPRVLFIAGSSERFISEFEEYLIARYGEI